jgi:hypothetical protein
VVVFISQGDKMGVAWLLGTDVSFNTPSPYRFHHVFMPFFSTSCSSNYLGNAANKNSITNT